MIINESKGQFIGFTIKSCKILVKSLDSKKTEKEHISVDKTKIFQTINEFLDYLITETSYLDISVEWDISRYKLEQVDNLFVLSRNYSDAVVQITFQPIIPKHVMTLEEYFRLTR